MAPSLEPQVAKAARLLSGAGRAIALTGAGVSTESGIPDFRSAGGVWSRFDPEELSYPRYVAYAAARRAFWRWAAELLPLLEAAAPNPAHAALAALERAGRLRCVITQNIDNLHQRAGSSQVIELHGGIGRVGCIACDRDADPAAVRARLAGGDLDPSCPTCGGPLKPRVVLFGELMPERELGRAFDEAGAADLLMVVGSSLEVYPAADVVPAARAAGAALVIVNRTSTPYDDLADVVLPGAAGEILPAVVERVLGGRP